MANIYKWLLFQDEISPEYLIKEVKEKWDTTKIWEIYKVLIGWSERDLENKISEDSYTFFEVFSSLIKYYTSVYKDEKIFSRLNELYEKLDKCISFYYDFKCKKASFYLQSGYIELSEFEISSIVNSMLSNDEVFILVMNSNLNTVFDIMFNLYKTNLEKWNINNSNKWKNFLNQFSQKIDDISASNRKNIKERLFANISISDIKFNLEKISQIW